MSDPKDGQKAVMLNMIWAVIAVVINYLMNFLLTPYVTNNIGVEAYGFVALATTFTNYVDIIAVGLNAFAGRFISMAYYRGEKEKANMFFSSTIAADFVLAVAIFIPGTAGIFYLQHFCRIPGNLQTDVKLLFWIVLVKYLLTVVRTAFDTAAFISNRLDITERQQGIAYLLQGGLLLMLCMALPPHVWYVGVAGAVSACYLLVANMKVCHRITPDLHYHGRLCSWNAVKEMISAGIWNSLNNLGNILNSGLDLLITNLMLDAVVLGEISIAKNLATICYTIVIKISGAFRPKQLQMYAENKIPEMVRLYQTAMKITGTFCSLVICWFYVCGYDFLKLWIPQQDTGFIFKASMIVLLSDIATGVVNPLYYVFTLTKKLKIPCMITILMGCANVGMMFILIRSTSLGAYAVVLTTLIVNLVHFIDTPVYSAWCLKISWKTFYPVIIRHLITVAAGMLTAVGLKYILPAAGSWISLIGKGAAAGVVLLLVLVLVMFPISEIRTLFRREPYL